MRRSSKHVGTVLVTVVLVLGCRKGGERGGGAPETVPPATAHPPVVPAGPAGEPVTLDLGGGVTMELMPIPAGEFTMGSPVSEQQRVHYDETQHRVRITKPFHMGRYEVTQAQYRRVTGADPSRLKGDDRPVERVSWDDATEFCRKLSQLTGRTVRLPTEAEWEYACRAGTTTPFHYGASLGSDQANFRGSDPYGGAAKGIYRRTTTSVGSFAPNAWGLHDMHGNVWEWCSDWYGEGYYEKSPAEDPTGPESGVYRIVRGGAWSYDGLFCRSARRHWYWPAQRYFPFGFRVVVVPSPGR